MANALERLLRTTGPVKIDRLSPATILGDLEPAGIAFLAQGRTRDQLTNEERHTKIQALWRCKIGKTGRWHYGMDLDEAISSALSATA